MDLKTPEGVKEAMHKLEDSQLSAAECVEIADALYIDSGASPVARAVFLLALVEGLKALVKEAAHV